MRVLIVKTSSLGVVIHTLPAVHDAMQARPELEFDWLVEEGFAEVPAWHPAIKTVIPVALRRWRKQPFWLWRNKEWLACRDALREKKYDLIIDAQGLLKSAWLSHYPQGPVVGQDWQSAREPLASLFYQQRHPVAKGQHAVERTRQLFALALGYSLPESTGHYGIDRSRLTAEVMLPEQPYLLFLHGTTRADKHWPEVYWQQLAAKVVKAGFKVLLPWGNEAEKQRAERIATVSEQVQVLPRLNLAGVAKAITLAQAVVAVDTGLGHLTAALDVPAVSLYGSTSPVLIGTYGQNQKHLESAHYPVSTEQVEIDPLIFASLKPEIVFDVLSQLMPVAKNS